jgi:Flp pilus assembly protein TadD
MGMAKEYDMHRAHTWIKAGAFILIGFFMAVVIVQADPADHGKPVQHEAKTFDQWMDQGGLLSTYGNYKAAAQAYEKALELSPNDAEAHFDLGVAWGQMGDYPKALSSIDKAVSLSPDEGRYHYGRGWVLLLSGRPEEAKPELMKAAELGSTEARHYLQNEH